MNVSQVGLKSSRTRNGYVRLAGSLEGHLDDLQSGSLALGESTSKAPLPEAQQMTSLQQVRV